MFHTYLPSVETLQLQALLEKKSKLEKVIMALCMENTSMHVLIASCVALGFKKQKVLVKVFELRNEGYLLEGEYVPHRSTMIAKECEGKPGKRM